MNDMQRRETTSYAVRVIMTIVASLAGVFCFIEEKAMLCVLYIGMALIFLFSMVFNIFRITRKQETK
ncbi:MAG: hypothetical protein J6Y08_01680 [Clostridiales bacterium]|nr:hypothetical protein [Clostridiales bacterium]